MFRPRLFFWVSKAFFKKHKKLIFITGFLGIALAIFVVKILPVLPLPRPTERIGLIGKYASDELPLEILQKLSQGLTVVAQDGSAVESLASWQINDKATVYTFRLKDNLFWQDGTEVRAPEIDFGFTDVEQEILDQKTIRFTLKEPFVPFPVILSKPLFKKELLGVGPYKVASIKEKTGIVESIKLAGPEKNILYKFYPTLEIAAKAFKLGEIDVLHEALVNPLPEDWQESLKEEKLLKKNQYVAVFLNNDDEFLKEKAVRQALAYALKKPEGEKRALGPISPLSWAYSSEVKKYDFDSNKARELLGKNKEEAAKIVIKLSTTQPFLTKAEEIEKSWEEALGIMVEVLVINTISDDFQALLMAQEIPADPDQYALWHSTQDQNFIHYKSPKVDKILEDGRKEADIIRRKELYADFQKFLLEDCPVIFLYHPEVYTIKRGYISHFMKENMKLRIKEPEMRLKR